MLMDAKPDILNHNIETVRRIDTKSRARAKYDRSLEFLRRAKEMQPRYPNKIKHNDWSWRNKRRNYRSNG